MIDICKRIFKCRAIGALLWNLTGDLIIFIWLRYCR
jgi:hypothetical protein